MAKKVKAVVDIDAAFFDFAHLYELFDERPALAQGYVSCCVPVSDYRFPAPEFVQITFDTPSKGEITLYIRASNIRLIEDSKRIAEEAPTRIGYKAAPPTRAVA